MIINEFEYSLNEGKFHFPKLIVQSGKRVKLPKTLSKYFALNSNNVHSFINRQLFATQPEKFNDLFDSTFFTLDCSRITPLDIELIFPNCVNSDELELFKSNPIKFAEKLGQTLFAFWNLRLGLFCTTNNQTDQLMWAHYTNNKGFLVEFDYAKFPFNFTGPYPINYLPDIQTIPINIKDIDLGCIVNFVLKHKIWKYEKEFRFIIFTNKTTTFETDGRFSRIKSKYETQPRLVDYPENSIRKVILGFNFLNSEKIVQKNDPEFIINFYSKDAENKVSLLTHLVENKIPTELIKINVAKFNLHSEAISISKVDTNTFKIIKI